MEFPQFLLSEISLTLETVEVISWDKTSIFFLMCAWSCAGKITDFQKLARFSWLLSHKMKSKYKYVLNQCNRFFLVWHALKFQFCFVHADVTVFAWPVYSSRMAWREAFTVAPWTTWVWTVWFHLHTDYFFNKYNTVLQVYLL